MKQKWPILIFSALLTAFIVLAGIWGNAQFQQLPSGGVLTAQQAAKGIAPDGWRQEAPGQWHFTFTAGEDLSSLTLCVTNTAAPLEAERLTDLARLGELYALDVTPGETVELVFACRRSPQTWLMSSAFADRAFRFRTLTQLITLTAFVTMGVVVLGSAPEALPALLPALRQRVEFLRRLTEDLFLAAKLEQKQLLLNEDHAALNEEAAAVCAACQSEADQKGVALCVSADVLLPVWGDSVRLQQILQNLVTNAIHYTPAGGSIHVVCRAEGGTACVSVQDTGCGIAPEDQGAVFDRYFHTSADKKHDSTGLGLTIAQELARLHHGEITLQSEVGRGSIFTLRLPLLNIEEYSSLRFYRKTRN